MATNNMLVKLVGLDDVKLQLQSVVDTYTVLHSR